MIQSSTTSTSSSSATTPNSSTCHLSIPNTNSNTSVSSYSSSSPSPSSSSIVTTAASNYLACDDPNSVSIPSQPSPIKTVQQPQQPRRRRRRQMCVCSLCVCHGRCCGCGFRAVITILSNVLSALPLFSAFAILGAANVSFAIANLSAIGIALICLFLDFLLKLNRLIRVFPKQLAVANVGLSTLSTVLALLTSDVFMKRWNATLNIACLCLMLLIGLKVNKPFKLELYQDMVPLRVWNDPTKRAILMRLSRHSTLAYVVAFVTMTVANAIIAGLETCPDQGNCELANSTVVPLLLMFFVPLIVMILTHRYTGKHVPAWQGECGYDEAAHKANKNDGDDFDEDEDDEEEGEAKKESTIARAA